MNPAQPLRKAYFIKSKVRPHGNRITPAQFERGSAIVAQLREVRFQVADDMSHEVDAYFDTLAETAIARASKAWPFDVQRKDLPTIRQLFAQFDDSALSAIVRRYYTKVLAVSWGIWDTELGIEIVFDLKDPLVEKLLGLSGDRIRMISKTTKTSVRKLLQYGAEQGWSIDQLVRGDAKHPGLRSIVQETYKNRARTIARTELGTAQNQGATERYADAGVKRVGVLDNGRSDDDEPCRIANGQIWTLAKAQQNYLEHPNCTRAFYAIVDGVKQ